MLFCLTRMQALERRTESEAGWREKCDPSTPVRRGKMERCKRPFGAPNYPGETQWLGSV